MVYQIPEEVVDEILKANDIVDVVGEYVQLKKQGRNFFGLCPFHNEKTPSFSVTQDKQIFHCFGCKKGGNAFTFIMEMEGFSFYEAAMYLANKSGINLPESDHRKSSMSSESQSMLDAYEWLTKLYTHILRYASEGKDGYNYFKNRGITDEAIDQFKLGFSPNIKNFTVDFLEKKGFHRQLLAKAGLISIHDEGRTSDRFAGRVIFPIRNHLGKTVAFGGRSLGEEGPKYLNSPESDLFQKGKLLYNFDLAKKHIRKQNEVILFEGYMDVIAAYQAEIRNVVATLGTALTENQAKLLRRYVDTVIICYDADRAGMEATHKAAALLRKAGCQVKIAKMKNGLDPDSFIQEYGSEAFKNEVIQASDSYFNFYMNYVKRDFNLRVEADRFLYIEKVLKELANVESPIEREYYLNDLSKEFNISLETLKNELGKFRNKLSKGQGKEERSNRIIHNINYYKAKKLLPAYHNAERHLLAYMLHDQTIADRVREEIGAQFNVDEHKIIATHLYAYYEEEHPADIGLFMEKMEDESLKKLIAEIAMIPVVEDYTSKEINDYLRIIAAEKNDVASLKELKEQQTLAEQENDPIKAAEIALKIIDLQKQVKHIY